MAGVVAFDRGKSRDMFSMFTSVAGTEAAEVNEIPILHAH